MSSYSNFQTDNAKHSKSRTDIYNSSFESPIKLSDGDFIDRNIHKWAELISFLRWYPDIAYDLMKPETGQKLNLDNDQRMALRMLVRMPDNYMCVIRGYGKTMLHIMAQYHVARFFPNITLSVTASTRESAVSIWQDKHNEILKFYPALKDEIKVEQFSRDKGYVEFVNGASIDALANSQKSKGQRRRRGGLEESNLIDKETLLDAVIPIFNIPRRTMGNLVDPEELNGQINRYTTSGYKNSDEFEVILQVLQNMKENKGSFLVGSDWILPVYYGRQKKSTVDKAREDDITTFKMNYLCEWVGASDGALINISKLMNARTLKTPELECVKDKSGKNDLVEYIISVDVARSASSSNNKSAIAVLKIVRGSSGKIRQVQTVNIETPPNGLTYEEQAIAVKQMFYRYGGDLDLNKSRVKAIVVDANVIGQGLVDELLQEHTDPDTNKELGAFNSMNTEQRSKVNDAPKLVYSLKAQGINGAIIRNFISYVEGNKLKLLTRYKDINNKDKNKREVEYKIACQQMSALIDEVANLKIKKTKNDSDITVQQVVRKVDKDRYSAIAYGLYYIELFMQPEEKDDHNWNDYFIMGSGW